MEGNHEGSYRASAQGRFIRAGSGWRREAAGCGPEESDFAEVHDCFTIAGLTRMKSPGLGGRGGMIRMIREGGIEISGRKPINPSGGLLGKGHPLGATGVAQVYEITGQLRGEAGSRQTRKARVGLARCRRGLVTGTEGAACILFTSKCAFWAEAA